MFSMGFSLAVSSRIQKYAKSSDDMKKAVYFAKLGFGAILMWAIIIQLIFEFFKEEIITTFTTDKPVQEIISVVFYLTCTFIALEVLNGAPMGIIRGLGL